LFLSYQAGTDLANAAQNLTAIAQVRINISTTKVPAPVGNICAHTVTGDATQTIVIGSHSDSVPAGPGINDNGKIYIYLD
jgi:Zn-dependent M28 family amino/carboxypeptidase